MSLNREEAEKKIARKMVEIAEVVRAYNPEDPYISLSFNDDVITFNNTYWEHEEKKIRKSVFMEGGEWKI